MRVRVELGVAWILAAIIGMRCDAWLIRAAFADAPPPNVSSCTAPITPIKNGSGNYGIINFGQYHVALQGYFVCDKQGVPYQAAIGQVPFSDAVITSGEVTDVSPTTISLQLDEKIVTYSIPKDARICRDFKPSKLTDIKKGHVITILTKSPGGTVLSVLDSPIGFTRKMDLGMFGCE